MIINSQTQDENFTLNLDNLNIQKVVPSKYLGFQFN